MYLDIGSMERRNQARPRNPGPACRGPESLVFEKKLYRDYEQEAKPSQDDQKVADAIHISWKEVNDRQNKNGLKRNLTRRTAGLPIYVFEVQQLKEVKAALQEAITTIMQRQYKALSVARREAPAFEPSSRNDDHRRHPAVCGALPRPEHPPSLYFSTKAGATLNRNIRRTRLPVPVPVPSLPFATPPYRAIPVSLAQNIDIENAREFAKSASTLTTVGTPRIAQYPPPRHDPRQPSAICSTFAAGVNVRVPPSRHRPRLPCAPSLREARLPQPDPHRPALETEVIVPRGSDVPPVENVDELCSIRPPPSSAEHETNAVERRRMFSPHPEAAASAVDETSETRPTIGTVVESTAHHPHPHRQRTSAGNSHHRNLLVESRIHVDIPPATSTAIPINIPNESREHISTSTSTPKTRKKRIKNRTHPIPRSSTKRARSGWTRRRRVTVSWAQGMRGARAHGERRGLADSGPVGGRRRAHGLKSADLVRFTQPPSTSMIARSQWKQHLDTRVRTAGARMRLSSRTAAPNAVGAERTGSQRVRGYNSSEARIWKEELHALDSRHSQLWHAPDLRLAWRPTAPEFRSQGLGGGKRGQALGGNCEADVDESKKVTVVTQ
ncbi:hypothetical protein B0H12DRAFT_1080169 [Mycena haematopus]|nr:hypothetical protein B0H12DRAFT_1080169 [Mycena haematopus]